MDDQEERQDRVRVFSRDVEPVYSRGIESVYSRVIYEGDEIIVVVVVVVGVFGDARLL